MPSSALRPSDADNTTTAKIHPSPTAESPPRQQAAGIVQTRHSVAAKQGVPHEEYRRQMAEVHGLGTDLAPAKIQELYAALMAKPDAAGTGLSLAEFNAVKNDILEKLMEQSTMPADLGRLLVDMYQDRSLDAMWRGYCVQHFAPYYERRWKDSSSTAEDPEAEAILSAYDAAVGETDNAIAGAALVGLERLSSGHAEVDRDAVAVKVLDYAQTVTCPTPTRVTTMQLCGTMGLSEIVPTARLLAQDAQATTALRLSAIGTLGLLGDQSDAELLESVSSSSASSYVRNAAQTALHSLDVRLAGGQQ